MYAKTNFEVLVSTKFNFPSLNSTNVEYNSHHINIRVINKMAFSTFLLSHIFIFSCWPEIQWRQLRRAARHAVSWQHTARRAASWQHTSPHAASWQHMTCHTASWQHTSLYAASWQHIACHTASWQTQRAIYSVLSICREFLSNLKQRVGRGWWCYQWVDLNPTAHREVCWVLLCLLFIPVKCLSRWRTDYMPMLMTPHY